MGIPETVEIEVAEFKSDPVNGAALLMVLDVKGPGTKYEMAAVYFSEDFIQKYFHIPWHKDLPKEEARIIHEKKELFIQWVLVKIEQRLKTNAPLEKIQIDYETEGIWAEKVEKGLIKPVSVRQSEKTYCFDPRKS